MAGPAVETGEGDRSGSRASAPVPDRHRSGRGRGRWRWRWRRWLGVLATGAVYVISWRLTDIDLGRLVHGLSTMWGWAARSWPPTTRELDLILERAGETVAIALIGTTLASVIALVVCVPAARNLTPNKFVRIPARLLLNTLRGVDSFVFALLFVAAVGLGPFAGMLGIAFHASGSIGKLFAEAIEDLPSGPIEAAELTGASRLKTVSYAIVPDALPALASVALYMFEFNIRSSVVLGVVGAGGIGQQLRNSIELLDFPRLLTIVLVILVIVTVIDQLSSRLRRALA